MSLVKVTRAPAPEPFRFPTPAGAAGAAAQTGQAPGPDGAVMGASAAPPEHVATHR
jgi:hypothetical protein